MAHEAVRQLPSETVSVAQVDGELRAESVKSAGGALALRFRKPMNSYDMPEWTGAVQPEKCRRKPQLALKD
jgi:hypothetical protein